MTPSEVRGLVDDQLRRAIEKEPERAVWPAADLERCLLATPERRTFLDSHDGNLPVQMWLVLEEDPVGHQGYQVVFDEARGQFGLAIPGVDAAVLIGYYGGLVETLRGM